jgi:hypothetical protein
VIHRAHGDGAFMSHAPDFSMGHARIIERKFVFGELDIETWPRLYEQFCLHFERFGTRPLANRGPSFSFFLFSVLFQMMLYN